MRNVRPTAASFSNIINNLITTMTTREAGYWTTFQAGSAPLNIYVGSSEGTHLFMYLMDDSTDQEAILDAVAIVPNLDEWEPEQWDIVGDRMYEGRRVALGSFKGLEAAVGSALERVCARNWYAGVQDAHDPVAV